MLSSHLVTGCKFVDKVRYDFRLRGSGREIFIDQKSILTRKNE
jgi:hypothetical protein